MSKLKDVYKEVPNWREMHKGMNRPEYVLKNGSARNCYGLLKDIHCLQEENQRLTEIATKHATRADKLYEALENLLSKQHKYKPHCKRHGIAHHFVSHHDFEAARKVLRKTHCNAPD